MISDYSNSYSPVFWNTKKRTRQKISGKKKSLSASRLTLKAVGFMVGITVLAGVSSTFWYGWQIRIALDDIGKSQVVSQELVVQNRQLVTQLDNHISQETIIARAGKTGLYPPTKAQVRRP